MKSILCVCLIAAFSWSVSAQTVEDVRYLLWTRSNSGDGEYYEVLWLDSSSLQGSPFDGSKKTYFIHHGWTSNGLTDWLLDLKNEFLAYEDCNVYSVDYESLVTAPNYPESVDNIYLVADRTADFIDWLTDETSLSLSNLHVMGHSLGAHNAGMVGHYMQSGKPSRVTGWDPAGPFFNNATNDRRLNWEDGDFVDIIHTNSGHIDDQCIGLEDPLGHVDFYPNGGQHMPGCDDSGLLGGDWQDLFSGCSHGMGQVYFLESIFGVVVDSTMTTFVSWPCESYETFSAGGCPDCGQGCLDMGLHVAEDLGGSYYLNTNDASPYAKGDQQS